MLTRLITGREWGCDLMIKHDLIDKQRFGGDTSDHINCIVNEATEYLINSIDDSGRNTVLQDAEYIMHGYYLFNNPWDMECCKKAHQLINGKTFFSPNRDPEWVYSYARMEYLRKLIIAYFFTGSIDYLSRYTTIVNNFYSQNNQKKSQQNLDHSQYFLRLKRKIDRKIRPMLGLSEIVPTYRTLDTAIRNYTLCIDLLYILNSDHGSEDFIKVKHMVERDLSFPIDVITDFDETSNWGVIKVSLTAICKLFFGYKIEDEQRILIRMLRKQIKKDGGHIENSNMYQVQILICLLRLIYWSQECGAFVENEIVYIAKKMTMQAYMLSDPLGFQLQYGDSDYTSLDTVLYIASEVLGIAPHLNHSRADDLNLLFEFPTLIKKDRGGNPDPKIQNVELDEGKWCFDSPKYCLRVFNESSKSGHNHADNGEVILYYKNKPVIIDTGRYSYYEEQQRKYYRGPLAHNIAIIDDGAEWEPYDNWRFKENPFLIHNRLLESGIGYRTEYGFKDKDYVFCRYVLVIEDTIIIVNYVEVGDGLGHELRTIWNFAEVIESRDDKIYSGSGLYFSYTGNLSLEKGRISLCYNEEQIIGTKATVSSDFRDFGIQVSCFSETAITISVSENNQYLINSCGKRTIILDVSYDDIKYYIE